MNTKTSYILESTNQLRNAFDLTEIKNILLSFTLLKRLDSILEFSKQDILKCYNDNNDSSKLDQNLKNKSADEKGVKLGFYNYYNSNLNSIVNNKNDLEENLIDYISCFSDNVLDIFKKFDINNEINKLSKYGLLRELLEKLFSKNLDLSPKMVSNHEMGVIFDELIQYFSKYEGKRSGMITTPPDISQLMVRLLLCDENTGEIKTIYDPACGCGGLLTLFEEFNDENENITYYGQDINPLAYAIGKSNLLIKGKSFENIKGPASTLSNDQFPDEHFDYILANPPFNARWNMDENSVLKEHEKGFEGRFGAGLPHKRDSQLLFLQHMISKMNPNKKSRVGIITSEAPLSFGDIGSGESKIRKWIFENDYLESIIALPANLFHETSIPSYILILTNEKQEKRINKVQLIDLRTNNLNLIKKSRSSKYYITSEQIEKTLKIYNSFEETDNSKILDNDDFGFKKIIIERPLQRSYQVTKEKLENLHSIFSFERLARSNNENIETRKKEENEGKLKQNQIKKALLSIGNEIYSDRTIFEKKVINSLSAFDLTSKLLNEIIEALSQHDETVEYELNEKGEIKPDPSLREVRKLPVKVNIEDYFNKQVKTNYPDAWVDYDNIKIGYEINFSHLNYDEKLFFEDIDYPIYHFENLVEIENIRKITNEHDFYLRTLNASKPKKIAYYPQELIDEEIKIPHTYIGCKTRNKTVLKEYLYHYLNSNKGLDHCYYFQRDSYLNKGNLSHLPIPLPDIKTQEKIIETSRLMENFFNEIEIWRTNYLNNILNYQPTLESYKDFSCSIKFEEDGSVSEFCHNWRIVYQGLIWPLAYTYLKATKGSKYESTIKRNYLVLFEFLAAFNVIILISAIKESDIPSNHWQDIKNYLWQLYHNNKKTWHNMHFGGWTTLYWRLSNIYKNEDYNFNTKVNREFFNKLASKRYQNLFNELRAEERNPEAHSGLEDDIDTESKLEDLKIYMDTEIFNILNLYSGLKLYYVENDIKRISPKKVSHDVMSLNGPCDPPNWHTIIISKELDPYSLYLYDPLNNAYLKLDSNLIRFGPIPDTKQYGIYIYDGVDLRNNVARYKCYHHKNEITEITLNTNEDTYFKVSEEFLKDVLRIL